MLIEISGVALNKGIVSIFGMDVSEENLQRIERNRFDDGEEEITFIFDTRNERVQQDFCRWLKQQKAAKGKTTYGEALRATVGTIVYISGRYRSWE